MLRHASIAIAVLAATIVPAGCGSDDAPATSTTRTATTTTTAAAPNEDRREFEDQIRSALERTGQAELVEVDCVIERLRETLPDALVDTATEAVERGEEIPQRAVDAAFEAGQDCASDRGGG